MFVWKYEKDSQLAVFEKELPRVDIDWQSLVSLQTLNVKIQSRQDHVSSVSIVTAVYKGLRFNEKEQLKCSKGKNFINIRIYQIR